MKYTIYAESFAVNITKYETNGLDNILNGNIYDIDDLDRKRINSFTGISANSRFGFYIESDDSEDNYYFSMDEISGFEDGEITEYVSIENSVILTKVNYSFSDKNLIKIGEFEAEKFDLFELKLHDFTLIDTMYFFTSMTYNDINIYNPIYPSEDANSLYLNVISVTNSNGNSVFNAPSIPALKDIFNENLSATSVSFSSESFKDIHDLAPLVVGYKDYFNKINVNIKYIYIQIDEEKIEINQDDKEIILDNISSIIFNFDEHNIEYSKLIIHFSEISSSFAMIIDIDHSEKEEFKHALIIDSMSCNDDNIENQFDIYQKSIDIVCQDEYLEDEYIEEENEDLDYEEEEEEKENLSLNKFYIKPVIVNKQYQEVSSKSIFEQLTDKDSYQAIS